MSRTGHVASVVHMRNSNNIVGGKRKWSMQLGIENWARDSIRNLLGSGQNPVAGFI